MGTFDKTIKIIEDSSPEELMKVMQGYGVKFIKNPNYKKGDNMKVILNLSFNSERGIECIYCMLSTVGYSVKGEHKICTALGSRPKCPEEGKREDCPLVIIEE